MTDKTEDRPVPDTNFDRAKNPYLEIPTPAETEELYDADPNCAHLIVSGPHYSGIRCTKCRGWFCY